MALHTKLTTRGKGMSGPKQDVWCITLWGGVTFVCGVLFLVGGLLLPAIAFAFAVGPIDPKGPATLVAGVGMPSFLLGHLFGIIALASDNAESKKLAKIGLTIIWMSFLVGAILVAIFRDK